MRLIVKWKVLAQSLSVFICVFVELYLSRGPSRAKCGIQKDFGCWQKLSVQCKEQRTGKTNAHGEFCECHSI